MGSPTGSPRHESTIKIKREVKYSCLFWPDLKQSLSIGRWSGRNSFIYSRSNLVNSKSIRGSLVTSKVFGNNSVILLIVQYNEQSASSVRPREHLDDERPRIEKRRKQHEYRRDVLQILFSI